MPRKGVNLRLFFTSRRRLEELLVSFVEVKNNIISAGCAGFIRNSISMGVNKKLVKIGPWLL